MKTYLFLAISMLFALTGCQTIVQKIKPDIRVQTITTPRVIYLHASVWHNKIVCPSRVNLNVQNLSATWELEVSVDSEPVIVLPPHGMITINIPESPYTNGKVLVTGSLLGPAGKQAIGPYYQFYMHDNGPVDGWLTASENSGVNGSYQIPCSPYGY